MTDSMRLLWRWVAAAALITGLGAVAGVGAQATYGALASGDEPFYLMTARSLAVDGDLDIADELASREYLPYHRIAIPPQTVPLDAAGTQLSPHDPLLPVLLAPAMALPPGVGWVVAKVLLALMSAATAGLTVWVAVRRLAVRPAVAGMVVAGLASSLPWAGYGTQVYPEMPAALMVLAAVAAATAPVLARRHMMLAVAAVIALPWLAVKFVPVAAALVLAAGVRAWTHGRRDDVVGAAVVLAVAGLAYLAFHLQVYGGWTVYAAGDHFVDSGEMAVVGISPDYLGRSRRLVGLLVDRRFGLAAWAPVWLAAPAGLVVLARRAGPTPWIVVGPVVAAWLTATFVALTMHGWWVPGRQVVVVLPLLALGVATLADQLLGRPLLDRPVPAGLATIRRPIVLLGLLGLFAGVSNWVWLAVEASSGGPVLIIDFADSAAPLRRLLTPLLPDGVTAGAAADLGLVVWGVVLLVSMVLIGRVPAGRLAGRLSGRPAVADALIPPDRVEVGS